VRVWSVAFRRLVAFVLAVAVLVSSAALPVGAQNGVISLGVDCYANPERTTVTNSTDAFLDLGTFRLASLDQPRANEPFTLPGGSLPPGGSITYLTGEAAPVGTLTLTRQFIYDNEAANEGARLITPFGTLDLLCSARAGGLRVGTPPPPGSERCFLETAYCARGRFLAYWLANGGLPINGYPISTERTETLEDGKQYTVQYFERVRMEYHPENPDPAYQVLLGQFGRRILQADLGREADPPAPQLPGMAYDPVTQHNFDPRFLGYWQANGGLAQFGRPLTEPFRQRLEDGREYEVQYFERARFEWHPEQTDPQYRVLLGQFGRRILGGR
jgi:hypothetical protein